jgi:hypothetical protein
VHERRSIKHPAADADNAFVFWYMRWFGAPRDLAERGPWARRHPFRASTAYALLVAAVLNGLAFMRIQEIGLSAALFGGSFLFLFLIGLAGISLGGRSLSKPNHSDPPAP